MRGDTWNAGTLMIKPTVLDQSAPPASIVVVQNWFDELKRLVPAKR